MPLNLKRPIAFIDIESTGINRDTDRIIELSICKLYDDSLRATETMRFHPQILIPAASSEIHGIKDEDVKDKPAFSEKAKYVMHWLHGCDIAGFNSNAFDVPLLFNEFQRAGIYWDYTHFKMIDVGNIFKIQEPRTLSAAVQFYCGKPHDNAHSAEADINATVDVFLAQVERYDSLPKTVDELHLFCNYGKPVLDLSGKFSYNEKFEVIINFGKYRNEPALNHIDFIEWMYYKADFPTDTRAVCKKLLNTYYKVEEKEDEEIEDTVPGDWMQDELPF